MEAAPNVEQVLGANVVELRGDDGLSGIVLDRPIDGSAELAVQGLFIEIGADSRVELAKQLVLTLNGQDELEVDGAGRTSVNGVFAAGDVTNGAGELKQTITTASQGALAATAAYEYVSEHGNRCEIHPMGYALV
jgi:thioredoxin reductase (NADPH)